uniref:Uncharacterized protein n=1 Tax=Peromyscus maniculatus bairdii TaxID=230844 RepID=A0A8C8W510_PERMB
MVFSYLMADFITSKTRITQSLSLGFAFGCYSDRTMKSYLPLFQNKTMLFRRELRPREITTK